jgi:hypothetical protein
LGDSVLIKWPIGTDITLNDREFKVHSSIKRCIANRAGFNNPESVFKSNLKVSRVDAFEYLDLFWTEIPREN